ncbi:biopolymer transporter ExbD [Roseibium marinum]|uniref:Biopolymer transport protein ExbD n=1 Tax=Roseibium marinum TaxID=281252 RepID=A0A2S3UKZ3_9HYPH|nr:biopolymer transporter ExbD [Roseibium marinum]POF28377.1 biopolymer transport protein ExbD [Roseibium marinum]
MRVERPVRKQKPISLTPLVDVIFLLLLFFMLSSTFTSFGQVEIGAPAGGGGSGAAPKALLVLREDKLLLNGSEIESGHLEEEARKLVERDTGSLLVLVRGGTTTQELVTVVSRLRTVPDLGVTVAGTE